MTITEARDTNARRGVPVCRRDVNTGPPAAEGQIDVVVPGRVAENVIRAIISAARTGKIGDGKIFICKIGRMISIRNDELRGECALECRRAEAV